MRQSFLPGFDDDLPFVLVDVELDEQADLRMIGRLLDGPDVALHLGDRVVVAFEDLAPGVSVPAFALERRAMSRRGSRRATRSRSSATRRARCSATRRGRSARIAVDTATRAIADAGLDVAQIDGFTTGALFPTAGAHTIQDGVSIVTSNWLAEHLGVNPRYACGLPGLRADPRRGRDGGQRGRERRRRLRAHAPRAAQPGRELPRQPDARSARASRSGRRRRATSDRWR